MCMVNLNLASTMLPLTFKMSWRTLSYNEQRSGVNAISQLGGAYVCSMSKDTSGWFSAAYVVISNLASGSAEPSALRTIIDDVSHLHRVRGHAHE